MKRLILLVTIGLFSAGLALASPNFVKINLPDFKSFEGGIAVNPVTHKVYIIAELATEGADDEKVVLVLNNSVLTGATTPTKLTLAVPPTVIPIANENEYIAIDSTRNLIYVATKFDVAEDESDTDTGDDDAEAPGSMQMPQISITTSDVVDATLGTLTVIDGYTDKVIATWYFPLGVEPEGVAVDPARSIVYVAAKAPEGEADNDQYCSSGTIIPDPGEPGDVECWTAGHVYAFLIKRAATPATPIIKFIKTIDAGDDPESIVFDPVHMMIYAANEDDGTVTIATGVYPDGTGGVLLTDTPVPPTQPYEAGIAPYSLGVFYRYGPNPLACIENKFEADKMAYGAGSVFLTDDRSRVARIMRTAVAGMADVPGATVCQQIPNSDGGGANTANNIAFMQRSDRQLLYVASEQNTVAIYNPFTMTLKSTITVPGAQHIDGIAIDAPANRVWLTDETLQGVFVLQGACADGTGACIE